MRGREEEREAVEEMDSAKRSAIMTINRRINAGKVDKDRCQWMALIQVLLICPLKESTHTHTQPTPVLFSVSHS